MSQTNPHFSSYPHMYGRKKMVADIRAPHEVVDVAQTYRKPTTSAFVMSATKKTFDGVHRERPSFFASIKKSSWRDSLMRLWRKCELLFRRLRRLVAKLVPDMAPRKLFYGSLTGGVALGMVGMGFFGQFVGVDVAARTSLTPDQVAMATQEQESTLPSYEEGNDIFFEYFSEASKEAYESNVRDMVKGYPIEDMLPYIFEQDHLTAAFLIGIAKKESNWGKRVPVLNGQDCFNYWGYRGIRKMMGTGGHTCFNSRKDAVDTVSKRLETLIHSSKLDTPEKMVLWKCGYSCAGHSRESVKKWISDVDMYFSELTD